MGLGLTSGRNVDINAIPSPYLKFDIHNRRRSYG
jgi:hypothetical protein